MQYCLNLKQSYSLEWYNCFKLLITQTHLSVALTSCSFQHLDKHTRLNAKAMPTNDTNYSWHIKAVELV